MKEKLRNVCTFLKHNIVVRICFWSLLAVAVVLLLLSRVPITKTEHYDMYGYIVSADGTILEEFDFSITGKDYNFIIDPPGGEISFNGEHLSVIEDDALILDFEWGLDSINEVCSFSNLICKEHPEAPRYTYGSFSFFNKKLNQFSFEHSALFNPEHGTFCMYAEHLADNAFIVGSTDSHTDPNALIESYKYYFGDPTIDQQHKIDWSMTGKLISGSGEVLSSCDLSISGSLAMGRDGEDQLDANIQFPKLFAYWYDSPATYTSQSRKYFNTPYSVFPHYAYNRDTVNPAEVPVFSVFALCPEKEYAIFNWEDSKDQYLVASTDPNVSPQEILAYFETYTEKFVIDD